MKRYTSHLFYFLLVALTYLQNPGNAFAQVPHDLGIFDGIGGYQVGSSGPEVAPFATRLEDLISNAVGTLTLVAGLYFLVMFIIGGLTWASAGGKSDSVENAKKRMTNAAIGLIVVVAAYSITFIIGSILGIEFLNPAKVIETLGPGVGE
ncbi:MAG: pilin [Patescibacteria group bacterium]|jgi:hypothetical protein